MITPNSRELRDAISAGALVFETAHNAVLDERLNRLSFYNWGDDGCCLPRGATQATLRGHLDALLVGDILLFEEVASPTTFKADDADHAHRWAVRLTKVTLSTDPSGQLFDKVPVDGPVDATEIAWDASDALPFPLCLSVKEQPGLEVSIALGNIVLADHGLTVIDEPLGAVPPSTMQLAPAAPADCCDKPAAKPVPPRFRPALKNAPLSHSFNLADLLDVAVGDNENWWPASTLLSIDPRAAMPKVSKLAGTAGAVTSPWTVRRDLLVSASDAADFVVEVEDSGRARLRFGDDDHGQRPTVGTAFVATYRVGNGVAGNVGSEAVAHVVSATNGVFTAVRNPMAAAGGVEREDIEAVRRDAPQAFRTQQRAVTPADYAAAAERLPDVQRAAATFRWTGSWYTVFVTPDRFGGGDVDATFKSRLRGSLERYRMAGYDLEVSEPRFVPLDIALHVCVNEEYFRSDVLHAVAEVLSSGIRPDGSRGLCHPDNFSFGQPVYLSRLIAAAQAVEGVDSIRADRFQRMISPSPVSLPDGVIDVGDLEIAELANNPNFRERGRLALAAGGGK
ncbi:hypothetical protein GALL_475720 [mine drainage metagenome]|uniref:Uncharacterized protein n=1 Tax=mine drainage metagenome TaxID=410659 RepID=A0A1J5Q4M6_9ZZZZ